MSDYCRTQAKIIISPVPDEKSFIMSSFASNMMWSHAMSAAKNANGHEGLKQGGGIKGGGGLPVGHEGLKGTTETLVRSEANRALALESTISTGKLEGPDPDADVHMEHGERKES